jgi:ER-bound oxygenase mpaB/B'/Rubber oxygenase, catalytic domain
MARSRAQAARLRLMIKGNPEPSEAEWQALGQAHWRGDPLADAVIDWMHAEGMDRAWPRLEAALAQGLSAVRPQDEALRAYLQATELTPPWLDTDRVRRGAEVLQTTGLHGMMVLRDAGLMAGYQASAINQTLVQTGALHGGAHKRVAETAAWWLACTADGGMALGADGHRQTVRVRLMHALVRGRLQRSPQWDADWLGLPINQVDMQATYLAFSAVQLLGLRMTGMLISPSDADAVMHLWRCIGWRMGVEDALMCDDETTGRVLLYRNVIGQAPADHTSAQLARALMDEPLSRPYPWAQALRGRIDRERHLSLVSWFVGAQGMRNLGLPQRAPWYPLMLLAPTAAGSLALRALPFLETPWRAVSRWQQTRFHRHMVREPQAGEATAAGTPEPASARKR